MNSLNEQIAAAAYRLKHLLKEREKLLSSWFPDGVPENFSVETSDDEELNQAIINFLSSFGSLPN